MNAHERRRVEEAIARNRAGDRRGVDEILRDLKRVTKRATAESEQVFLGFMLDTEFHCARLDAKLRVRECLEWRGATWPSGGRKGMPKHAECQGCEVGEMFARCLPGVKLRPPTQPAEVLAPGQRKAKRVARRVELGDGVMEPLSEAASLTPDDRTDWRG